jgi:hypothetical protein
MGLFRQITDTLPSQSISLGQTVRFVLPRDFPREAIMIKLTPIVSVTAATLNAERAFGLIRRVRLTANDGGQQRILIDCDGMAIQERAQQYGMLMDSQTAVAFGGTLAAATYNITFPFFFGPPNLGTPTRDMFLQNFPRFNNDPVLEITMATQAEMDSNATPTFAITSATVTVMELKREVAIPNWRFLNTEFIQQEVPFASTVTDYRYQLPVPGYHTMTLMRPYSSVAALSSAIVTGNVRFEVLNVSQLNMPFDDMTRINQRSIYNGIAPAAADLLAASLLAVNRACIDWISTTQEDGIINLDTLLDTNPFSQLGTGPVLKLNVTGDSDNKIVFLHERIFGDISSALIVPRYLQG